LLQISSFNGKMNALNEVNKVISNVSFQSSRHSQMEEDEWLTADKMAVSQEFHQTKQTEDSDI
jgi:ubiquitin carboxyl-terminal hydrolase 9/24